MRVSRLIHFAAAFVLLVQPGISKALNVEATSTALRLANTITGGFMPTNDPLFLQMVTQVEAGNIEGAALTAANSKYFASYLARRLALQMQTPALDASSGTDNDATAFLIAKFVGAGTVKPSLSTIWSENATYLVNLNGVNTRAASLTPAQLSTVDWMTQLVQQPGQQAKTVVNNQATPIDIPLKHVGGYATLSDRASDNSFAQYGASAGTNLRYIEGIWEIATGLEIMDFANTNAQAQDVPRFIPAYDPNFFKGQGQPACLACHGGGLSALSHGYSALADTFNFDPANGLVYIPTPTNATRKSLGSDQAKRNGVATCNLVQAPTTVCNPDSVGVDNNQGWDLGKVWGKTGILANLGWTGPTTGAGINELGQGIGKMRILYENFVKRVVNEICPMGMITKGDVAKIAAAANPYATPAGSDDIRTIVSKVAAHATCL